MSEVAEAIRSGELPGRLWFYSNYHCNLACSYCLVESAPKVPRRALTEEQLVSLGRQGAELGFTDFGITGGEPFLLPYLVDVLKELASLRPTLVLSNATIFGGKRFAKTVELAEHDVAIQISLDAAEPVLNDEMRGPENFAKVVEAVPRLVDAGVRVRIATTVEEGRLDRDQHARLCDLHRSWGINDDDHIVRPIISRGRAIEYGMGTHLTYDQYPAELTLMAEGAFWSPFGPTFLNGKADTDLLITRTIDPVATPANALLGLARGRPQGADSQLGIR